MILPQLKSFDIRVTDTFDLMIQYGCLLVRLN